MEPLGTYSASTPQCGLNPEPNTLASGWWWVAMRRMSWSTVTLSFAVQRAEDYRQKAPHMV